MGIELGVVMDPIESIKPRKDSTLAMLLAAQARGWGLRYFTQVDLFLRDGAAWGRGRPVTVRDGAEDWFDLGEPQDRSLAELDVLLMRKDPPFDMEYVHTTYLLERAEEAGVCVVNRPASLRDVNEKLYTAWFPQCTPPTLVSRDMVRLRAFLVEQGDVIVKPLEGMGGMSVFRLRPSDANVSVTLEVLTNHGRKYIMAQRFIPEVVSAGDKRILLIDGEPIPHALARFPAEGETRANLSTGGRGEGISLTQRDRWICEQVGPRLKQMGLVFVGLDVIGDYLTEINVTSPTCIRELDRQYDLDIAGLLMDRIARGLGGARG